jgi:hypothetical protein
MVFTTGYHVANEQILALMTKLASSDSLRSFLSIRTVAEIERLPSELYQCSQVALNEANYLVVRQVRHIQVSHSRMYTP